MVHDRSTKVEAEMGLGTGFLICVRDQSKVDYGNSLPNSIAAAINSQALPPCPTVNILSSPFYPFMKELFTLLHLFLPDSYWSSGILLDSARTQTDFMLADHHTNFVSSPSGVLVNSYWNDPKSQGIVDS